MREHALSAAEIEGRGADAIAEAIVSRGVAPDAAVGWAARTCEGWELEAGRASAPRASASLFGEPIFDLASLTKPLTAFAIARSARLSRDDRLGAVLEEARGTASEDAPLELLLAHRAGLEAHAPLYEPLVAGRTAYAAALRRAADARRPEAKGPLPAGGFAPVYSDLGYVLAGAALARTAGVGDAGEAIERLVADALGRADLGTARSLAADRSLGFDERVRPTEVARRRGGEVRGEVHDDNAWALSGRGASGHAGIFGTVTAVLAFGCAALDAIARRRGPLACGDLSWLVEPRPGGSLRAGFDGKSEAGSSAGDRAGPRTFGHLGFTGTSLWIDPDAETVVAALTNRVYYPNNGALVRAARPVVHDALFALAHAHVCGLAAPSIGSSQR